MRALEEYDSLGLYLHDYREELSGSKDWFTTFDIEAVAEISQSYASRVETGRIDHLIRKWPPPQQLRLLQGYRLDEGTIIRLSRHFNLYAHLLLNADATDERLPIKGQISGANYETPILVAKPSSLMGKDVFAKELNAQSLVSQTARPLLPPKATLFFATPGGKVSAKKGDIILYLDEDTRDEFLSTEGGDYHVIDTKPPKVIQDHARLTPVGIYLGHIFLK